MYQYRNVVNVLPVSLDFEHEVTGHSVVDMGSKGLVPLLCVTPVGWS